MKKKIAAALAATFVLGVTSAFANNPFIDVPAKHWSYDSVNKLAKAGIVDGYGDGTFRGDKNMTRYEMAQIVAKAMTKLDKADAEQKAMINKLSAEYASELNNLGVRVGALEKKMGTVKFTGDARVRWVDADAANGDTKFEQRFRLNMEAQINENTSFYGRYMVMDHNEMGTTGGATPKDKNQIVDAAMTSKNLFNTNASATVGRFSQKFGSLGYVVDTTGMVDGVKVTAGKDLKVTVGFANFKPASALVEDSIFAEASYNTSKVTNVKATWMKEQSGAGSDVDYKGLAFSTKFAKDFGLDAEYFQNTAVNGDPAAYVARVSYKGANKNVQGTWGAYGEYLRFEQATYAGLGGAMTKVDNDRKAWNVGFNYTLAKNITFEGMHAFNAKVVSTNADAPDYTRFQVNYMF